MARQVSMTACDSDSRLAVSGFIAELLDGFTLLQAPALVIDAAVVNALVDVIEHTPKAIKLHYRIDAHDFITCRAEQND